MGARTKARKRALDMLYVADVRQVPLQEVLDEEARRAAQTQGGRSRWQNSCAATAAAASYCPITDGKVQL